jgi:hypothetical protein
LTRSYNFFCSRLASRVAKNRRATVMSGDIVKAAGEPKVRHLKNKS